MKSLCKRMLFILFAGMIFVLSCSSDTKTLSVSPASIDFDDVNIGSSVERELTLTNKYGKVLTIKGFTLTASSDFLLISGSSLPVVIEDGKEHVLKIRFEPSTDGKIEGTLSIEHDCSEKDKVVNLKGRGLACARIVFSDKSHDFMKKTIGKSHTHDIDILNNGTDTLEITGLNIVGSGATAYKVTSAPITILPGTNTLITVTFEPTALITYDAELAIEHNAVNEDSAFNYTITGEGRDADPQITLNQSSPWDFGRAPIGKAVIKECEIENTGLDPLKISSVSLQTGAEFTIDSSKDSNGQLINYPFDIAVGDKIIVAVQFLPTAKNTFNDTLSIDHDGTNEASPIDITIEGVGSAGGLDFNGDGYNDVIVGARGDDDGGTDSGCAYIFFGSSSPASTIDASVADVKIVGGDPGDQLNFVAGAGDFNDDGYDDVIIGAIYDDDGGTDAGCAFMFFGSATPPSIIDASNANVKFVGGDPNDRFGIRVSNIGDFNNDGIDDVIIGAYQDDDGGTDSGCAFIFFGSKTPASVIDASAADIKFIGGDPSDRFGIKANSAGDFNNDGIADIVIGADMADDGGADSGSAYIYFGTSTPLSTYDATAADVTLIGADPDDRFGYSLSLAGDFNNDGFDDIIVGANMDDDAGSSSGTSFIFFGSATPPNTIDASAANVKLIGEATNDRFGVNVSATGDINNDGFFDVIVASSYKDFNGTDSGVAYIFLGSATPAGTINASAADIKLYGTSAGDMFAHNNASAGDFNGDGITDFVCGAYGDDDGGTDSGCVFLFFGTSTPASSINATAANVKFVGADSGDRFFTLVSY